MKSCLVSAHFPPDVGGMQTYAYQLSRRLAARYPNFFVATVGARRADAQRAAAIDRAQPYPVHRIGLRVDELACSGVWKLAKLCRQQRTEVAVAVHWAPAAALAAARSVTGYPRHIVTAAHGNDIIQRPLTGFAPAQWVYDAIRRYGLRHSARLLPVSHYTAARLVEAGLPPERVHVVHNGVDVEALVPGDTAVARRALGLGDARVLLSVARLVQRKGIDTCLQAVAQARSQIDDLLYIIVGDGPDRPRLDKLAQTLGIAAQVRFVGRCEHQEKLCYLQACEVFALTVRERPGDVEGFGIVYLEANACGKAVIGSRSGGVVDAVRDGETGLLVPPDDVEATTDAIVRLFSDRPLADRLGANGRRYVVERASWEQVADQVATHCEAVLGQALSKT